jgi:hypothetical protein
MQTAGGALLPNVNHRLVTLSALGIFAVLADAALSAFLAAQQPRHDA